MTPGPGGLFLPGVQRRVPSSPPRGVPLLAVKSQHSRKGAGVRRDSVLRLRFGVIGPHQAGHFLFIRQFAVAAPPQLLLLPFPGLLHLQLRFIRDPVNHSMPRTRLGGASRRARPSALPSTDVTDQMLDVWYAGEEGRACL